MRTDQTEQVHQEEKEAGREEGRWLLLWAAAPRTAQYLELQESLKMQVQLGWEDRWKVCRRSG